jgi:acetylornithine deacetylase/succinyl-diaminopimelate desuccinylase-like protein
VHHSREKWCLKNFSPELIALPSVNPAFLPAGDERGGEWRATDYLSALAAKAGLPVEYQEVLPAQNGAKTRRNLIVRWSPASKPRQRISLRRIWIRSVPPICPPLISAVHRWWQNAWARRVRHEGERGCDV